MFASRNIPQHLIRGILAALLIAMALSPVPWWMAVPAVVAAMVLMRGCPMCWLIGLVMTIANRVGIRNTGSACPVPGPRGHQGAAS